FINDLKYPLRISENGVQFRDEPVETWFRNNFNAEHENFEKFVSILSEKSVNDPYVATTFPRLLFAVKRYDELVALSLGDNLNFDDPVIKRETFKSRIEYSLKACLVTKKYDLACKLLFRFSEEVETTSRQSKFIQDNYALLAILASSSKVADVLFRKHKDDWYGIEQGRKAAIMSPHKLLLSECMQCLDMANVWLDDYLSKPKEEFHREEFSSEDIAAICFAILFIQTPERVVRYITGWSPKLFQTKCAYKLGINLLMLSPFSDSAFFKVTEAAKDKMHILIGLIIASDKFQVKIPNDIIDNVSEQLCDFEGDIEDWHRYGAIIVVEAICHDQSNPNLVTLLKKYSWPQQDYGFTGYGEAFDPKEWGMRYFSLQASFNHVDLSPEVILLPKEQMRVPDNYDETFKRINKQINYFGRVYEIRAKLLFGTIDNAKAIELFNSLLTTVRSDCYQLKHNYDLDANNVISFLSQAIFSTLCKSNDIECDKFKELLEKIESIELHKPISIRINLAKYLVQFSSSDDISSYILELLDTAASRLDDYLESASDKAQTYADIAKVASIVSNEDANAYLDIAFESLEQLDHNSREMLDACCSLANDVAIDGVSRPKEAYQLARISELIHSMNDHKFPWGNVVKSLTYSSPESSLAITSRWRERNVGWDVENIGVVSKYLVANKIISSSAIHSMEVYGEYWDYGQYFDLLLQNASCREECEQIYTLLINDVKSDKKVLSMGGSVEVENIAKKFKLHHFSFTGVAQLREKKERESTNPTYLTDKDNLPNKQELPANLAILIESFSFENIQNLLELINKINQEEFPRQWDWQDVFNALREKLTVKQRPKYFQYLAECYEIDHDDLLNEIEKCCLLWKTSPAIKKLQPLVIDTVITLRGVDIISSWYRASKQIKKLADIAKKDEAEIFSKLLATIVSHIDSLPSHSLQFLLRKIFQFFDINNKSTVLEYALERFERYCGDDVADGKWQAELIPPNDINDAIARYIWCGLASPESEIRWRSAHTIKRLCSLGQQKIINSLFNLLSFGENSAFVDRRLPFYRMHAEMYFLMAIARIIHDYPKLFIEHSVVIFEFSTQKVPHVFIRKYAKSAALSLFNYDRTIYNQEQISLLNSVNTSLFSKEEQPKNRRYRNSGFGNTDSGFHFTNDMDRYWFPNLSDVFGIATTEIEKMASDLIINEWGGADSWVWNDDTRAKYQLYIGDSHATHGSYPETDRYSFYLGLHAMAIVAGQLLLKYPILEDNHEGDRFEYWLSRHTVSVDSAKWQSDRRDGCPLPKRPWMGKEYNDENWKWYINNQDFIDIIIPKKGFIQLSSDIVFMGECGKSEKIHISSALVTPNSSLALIRSLQLESNHHNYSIPLLGQHSHDQENHNENFDMKGFMHRAERESGIEQFDPLAGDIDFPAVTLGEDFITQCSLIETSDGVWSKINKS
ncbi:MAG: hypothetical protein JKX76_00075, partial [Colwellia sp.]|nr:hypothetical protein [Colwellia sp.]